MVNIYLFYFIIAFYYLNLLGSENNDNINLIELTTQRKRTFSNALLDIMKEHHEVRTYI